MTFPNIPEDINPIEDFDKEQVALLLLASIAFEELGLAHIINAEAEKIQFALGTLGDNAPLAKDFESLLEINRSVEKVLRTIIKKEIILQFKLENVVEFLHDD